MCRQKLYGSTTLAQHELLFELHKMGCAEEIVLAGYWAHTVRGDELPGTLAILAAGKDGKVKRQQLVRFIARHLARNQGATFAGWLGRHDKELASRFTAGQESSRVEQAALVKALAGGASGRRCKASDVGVAFVVAVYGNVAPLSPEVMELLQRPNNVVLLQDAPRAASAAATGNYGRRLHGFYPVCAAHYAAGVQLADIPAPVHPDVYDCQAGRC